MTPIIQRKRSFNFASFVLMLPLCCAYLNAADNDVAEWQERNPAWAAEEKDGVFKIWPADWFEFKEDALDGLLDFPRTSWHLQVEPSLNLTDRGMEVIAKLPISGLSIFAPKGATEKGWKLLGNLSQLEDLMLSNAAYEATLSEESWKSLAGLPALRKLAINDSDVSDAGMSYFGGSMKLEAIDLMRCGFVTSIGLLPLAKLPNLRFLSLHFCEDMDKAPETNTVENLTEEELKAVKHPMSVIGAMQNLEYFYSNRSLVATDEGLSSLKNLKQLKRIVLMTGGYKYKDLGLLTEKGLMNIAEIPSLEWIELYQYPNPLSDDFKKKFRELSKARRVHFGGADSFDIGDDETLP